MPSASLEYCGINFSWLQITAQIRSFRLRISSVNVTKSAVNYGFVHIYWRNPWWKTSFFVRWMFRAWIPKILKFSKIVLENETQLTAIRSYALVTFLVPITSKFYCFFSAKFIRKLCPWKIIPLMSYYQYTPLIAHYRNGFPDSIVYLLFIPCLPLFFQSSVIFKNKWQWRLVLVSEISYAVSSAFYLSIFSREPDCLGTLNKALVFLRVEILFLRQSLVHHLPS